MPTKVDLLPPRYRSPVSIGRGGMGDIVRATDDVLGRVVAIKLLAERYAADAAIRDRFKREALAAARLSGDPNTVTIFDVGEWEERPFIVMEYLEGGSLEDRVRRDGLQEPGQVLDWLEQAARALDAAHEQGIVHRDVKPGNLLLDGGGNVHVADFGIASATGLDSLTATGTVLGTAGYLAPEQARGGRTTPASDRYALAVLAFELLTGERPYSGDTPAAEAAAHVHGEIPSISERGNDLPPELDRVFQRGLAKDPEERYPTSVDFVADLRGALDEAAGLTQALPIADGPAGVAEAMPVQRPVPEEWEPAQPRRVGLSAGPAVAILVLLGFLVGGIALGSALVGGDDEQAASTPSPRTVVRTVTRAGEPQRTTVTVEAESPPAVQTPAPPAGSASSLSEARRLNDQATELMRDGDYASALPLAQSALDRLRGTGDRYEAYAEYNVGRSLIELGRCDEGLPHLDRSEDLQGHRSEFDEARAKCR